MNFVDELKWRGMIHDIMPGTEELLAKGQTTAYVGIRLPILCMSDIWSL